MPKEIQALSAPPVLLLLLLFWRFAPKSSCKKRPLLKLVPRIPRVRVEQYLPVCTIRRPTKVPAYVVYVRTVRRPLPETHVDWRMGAGATTKLLRGMYVRYRHRGTPFMYCTPELLYILLPYIPVPYQSSSRLALHAAYVLTYSNRWGLDQCCDYRIRFRKFISWDALLKV